MTKADPVQMASYELPFPAEAPISGRKAPGGSGESLPESILARNVLWLCHLRWIVITIFVAFGALGAFPDIVRRIGLRPPGNWPFAIAAIAAVYNLVFLRNARATRKSVEVLRPVVNLWGQIVLDLIVLTVVVHLVGSRETLIPFAYLFHTVLACIFFSRPHSFAVTMLACVLYVSCVVAEETGIISSMNGIYLLPLPGQRTELTSGPSVLNLGSTIGIWLVVWYLAAFLSTMVRKRDKELAQTNHRLREALKERARHMLQTTHELKAPFAAIHANTQLLIRGRCGKVSTEVLDVLHRISARCQTLAPEIQEMLQLENLGSTSQTIPCVELDLADVLQWCIAQVQPIAEQRSIVLEEDIHSAPLKSVEDHLRMVFSNLLSNAIIYSHEGGHVRIQCRRGRNSHCIVIIADDGIGIPAEKLPHIFDKHYRTKEAAQHNKGSSGLGLTIVRRIAEAHGIHIRVVSSPGAGTTFELRLSSGQTQGSTGRKETQNGIRNDRR